MSKLQNFTKKTIFFSIVNTLTALNFLLIWSICLLETQSCKQHLYVPVAVKHSTSELFLIQFLDFHHSSRITRDPKQD